MRHILIVEDIAETSLWLRQIALDAHPQAEVTLATNLRSAQHKVADQVFDLALIDIGLPDGSGIDLLRALRNAKADTLCVITTVMSDDATIVAALSAGADGYLLKESAPEVLARQLLQIGAGIPPLSPPIARRIMEHFRLTGPSNSANYNLTQRETDVLALIARGLRNLEVAQELELAETTIAGYIKSIYRKLGISSRAEASWHATQMGLTADGKDRR